MSCCCCCFGLFTSELVYYAQVDAGSAEELGAAVARVWASLYTKRAVLTRRAAGAVSDCAACVPC